MILFLAGVILVVIYQGTLLPTQGNDFQHILEQGKGIVQSAGERETDSRNLETRVLKGSTVDSSRRALKASIGRGSKALPVVFKGEAIMTGLVL